VSVHKTKSGSWRVMWREPDGTQKQKTFRRERDARKADRAIGTRLELGQVGVAAEAGPMTMTQLYADWRVTAEATLASSTVAGYRAAWKHLEPIVGYQHVRSLDGPGCLDTADVLRRQGLGRPTQAKTLALLSTLLRHAILRRQIPAHPMRGVVKVPQPRRARVVAPPAPEAIWRLARTLAAADDRAGRILVLLVGFAGLRPAEALALDWRDVGKRTLNVDKTLVRGTVRSRTKTGRSRTVDLLPALETELVAWRLEQGLPAKGPVLGELWNDDAYRNWRRRSFQPAATLVGAGSRPYDLRHAFASLLIAEQRNILDVAAQLGHAPSLCLDTYGHVMRELAKGRKVNAARAVDRARKSVGAELAPTEREGRGR